MAGRVEDLGATELVAAYRARSLSPVEVVEALGSRIERLASLGAFSTLCLDRSLEEARDAEEAWMRGDARPLEGVPFAAKDLFDTAGVRTTYGSRIFESHVPDRDAAAVAALRAAGGVLVGKTQLHEFAWGITSVNEAMGSSRNPWDPDRVPGGSSGGNGVALAARLVPLAVGSDTGGSIRIPSAFCGVCGLKPTFARLPIDGVWPLAASLDHVGPMARTPEDIALLMPELAGAPGVETVVVCPDLHLGPMSGAAQRAFDDAIATFERLGARVVERRMPGADRIHDTFMTVQMREAAETHERAGLFPERADEYGDDVRRRIERGRAIDLGTYVAAVAERERLRAAFLRVVADGAVLVTPVSGGPPLRTPGHTREEGEAFRAAVLPYTVPHDLFGVPSCAVRAGFDELGLPIGIQIAAAPWQDAGAVAAARAFFGATPAVQERWPSD